MRMVIDTFWLLLITGVAIWGFGLVTMLGWRNVGVTIRGDAE